MLLPYLRSSAFICGCILLITSAVARADEPAPHQPEEFVISYWCGPPAKFMTLERFQEVKEAGFTLAFPNTGAYTPDANRKLLDLAQQVGLKAVIHDHRMPRAIGSDADKAALDAIIKDYSDHPALYAYHVLDEPNAAAFDGLAQVVAYIKEKDPKHPGYINLNPTYAREHGGFGTPTYEEYVRQYAQKIKPTVISYDHYHFINKHDRPDFFENLYTVRNVALEQKLPFWNIVLVTQHFGYRHLTEAELRFEAMQTLAFGAKGLIWFTYWSPAGFDKSANWEHAMINEDGSRDPHYDMVKKINADVLAISNELLKCTSTEVFQTGKPPTTKPSIAKYSPPMNASASSPIKILDEGDLTVGIFKSPQRKRLALIANRDYKAALTTRAVVQPVNATVEMFDPAKKSWSRAPLRERGVIEIQLPAGGATLLRW